MTETAIIVSVLVVYLVALFAIAAWSHGETATMEGYYLGGRKLPFWVAGFSANATGESGWLLLGLTGMGYLIGVHALWIALGEALGLALAWLLVAKRLKRATDRYGSITVPDFLEDHYNDKYQRIRKVSVAIIIVMVGAYTAAQMVATGKAFSTFLPMSYSTGVLIGGGITLLYTAWGGFKAVAYSDLLQGVLMLAALIGLPIAAIAAVGPDFFGAVEAAEPELMMWAGKHGLSAAGIGAIVGAIAVGLPFMGVPQLLVRYMAIRDEREIHSAATVSVVCVLIFDIGAVLAGMAGRVLFPDLSDAETILPTMARELFPPLITGLLLVIVLAAIMSTVDSLLILASSAVVRDYLQKLAKVDWTERQLSRAGQLVTFAIGIAAVLIALPEPRAVFFFVLFAWSGLAAAFAPPVISALFIPGTTRTGALAGMLAGFATDIVWAAWLKELFFGLYEIVPALIVGFATTVLVSRAARETP